MGACSHAKPLFQSAPFACKHAPTETLSLSEQHCGFAVLVSVVAGALRKSLGAAGFLSFASDVRLQTSDQSAFPLIRDEPFFDPDVGVCLQTKPFPTAICKCPSRCGFPGLAYCRLRGVWCDREATKKKRPPVWGLAGGLYRAEIEHPCSIASLRDQL